MLQSSARVALNTRDAVYYERSSLVGGGELELQTYFHRTRRNLIVVVATLDCSNCSQDVELSMRAFSGQAPNIIIAIIICPALGSPGPVQAGGNGENESIGSLRKCLSS